MKYLDRTDVRMRMLDAVARGVVELDRGSATWFVEGEPVSGWDQRTLVELWREGGHIVPLDPADPKTSRRGSVQLTQHGKAAHRYWSAAS